MQNTLVLSVDLGGTKTAVALIQGDAKLLHWKQEATCQSGPQDGFVQISRLLNELIKEKGLKTSDIQGIGVGIPAVLEPQTDRVLWAPNLAGWKDVDLRGALEKMIDLPVFIEYDGHTAVLGEWWAGAGKGYQNLVSVIIGTGIGGGMVLEGKLIRGNNRLAGAAGWFALTTQSEPVNERAHSLGFWESYAAGPGLALHARAQLDDHRDSSLWELEKLHPITTKDIFKAASQGDYFAKQVINGLADLLGLGLANIVSLVNPQIVILGGSIGANCQNLLPRIRSIVKHWAQPVSGASVKIVTSRLGTTAGLLGAAYGALLRLNGSEKTVFN